MKIKILIFFIMMVMVNLSHTSIFRFTGLFTEVVGPGLTIYYCEPNLSWEKFAVLSASCLTSCAAGVFLRTRDERYEKHQDLDVKFCDIFTTAYAWYQLYNLGHKTNKKTKLFLGTVGTLFMLSFIDGLNYPERNEE